VIVKKTKQNLNMNIQSKKMLFIFLLKLIYVVKNLILIG